MFDLIGIAFLFIVMGILVMVIVANFIDIGLSMSGYSVYKRRAEQLKREIQNGDASTIGTIERLTQPVVDGLFPKISKWLPSLSFENQDQLKKELALVGWDDTFTPITFVACGIILKIVGVIGIPFVFLCVPGTYQFIGFIVCFLLFIGLDAWFKSEVKTIREELFSDFPDLIRIISGYLSADIPLVDSVKDSLQYVGKSWKPVLAQFVIDCDTRSVIEALDTLKDTIDLFEVKEFVSLVKLTLEQGGDVKDGFLQQAEKINDMRRNAMYIKIGKRKTMSTVLQLPLLILNTVVILIPTVSDMLSMF